MPAVPIDDPRPSVGPGPRLVVGTFLRNGGFVVDPRTGPLGPVEHCAGMAQAGFGWVAFNVGDFPSPEWGIWRQQARWNELRRLSWARCRTLVQVRQLRAVAETWAASGLIVNLEQEPTEPRWRLSMDEVADALDGFTGDVGVSTEPWLPDNADWRALDAAGFACLPQAFMNDDARWRPEVVVARARALGFRAVSPTFGIYGDARDRGVWPIVYRNPFRWDGPFSLYRVDDVTDWTVWR